MTTRSICLAAVGLFALPAAALAQPEIKPILDARLRYEQVDQTGLPQLATGMVYRVHAGFETTPWHDLSLLVEGETVQHLGDEHYAISSPIRGVLNGQARYPAINDPINTELNRAQITWKPSNVFSMVVGRQRLPIDDQRYIGSPAWRLDEQTFDAVRADLNLPRLTGTYIYIARVNRNLQEDWRSDSQALEATYTVAEPLKIQGFIYALDFGNAPIQSNKTEGFKLLGKVKLGDVQIAYDGSLARQTDYRGNSAPYDLGYREASLAATKGIVTGKVTYERMEGDGVRGLITPIAAAHQFQGWADAFSAVGGSKTFVDGIDDLDAQVVVRPKWKWGPISPTQLSLRYYDFDNQRFGVDLAHELDAEAVFALNKRWSLGLVYADFQRAAFVPKGAATPPASRKKAMVYLDFKL